MLKKKKYLLFITFFFICVLNIKIFAHEHTNDCYAGTKHLCDGNETSYGLCYTKPIYHTHTNECYSKECKATDITSTKKELESICSICGTIYVEEIVSCNHCNAISTSYFYCSNETCENYKKETITITHNLLADENLIKYGSLICNKDETTIDKYEKTCNKENGSYYYGSEKINPSCDKVVVSIKAIEEIQITNTPNLKLLATYLDGHTVEIDPTSTSYLSNMTYTNAQIQLNYYGLCKNASSYGNLNATLILSTPTQIPTPTPTQIITTPTPAPTIIEITTPIPTIETEPIIDNPYKEDTPPIEITPDKKEEENIITPPIKQTNTNNGIIMFLLILIILLIIGFTIINLFLFKIDNNEDEDEDEDEDELNNNIDNNNNNDSTIYQNELLQQEKNLKESIQKILNSNE